MTREVRWERMFPDELDAALGVCPLVYLTYGLCEPHGPQSALGMDALRPHAVACRAARRHGGIVAPPHYWHIHDYGIYSAWADPIIGEARPWLTPVPPWIFFKNVFYHVRAVDALGFRAAVLFTGHAGPHSDDLARVIAVLQPHVGARLAFVTDGDLIPPEYLSAFGHAGNIETSYLWASEPDCVDMSRLPTPDAPGPH
ncbi:MAG: creatininase family protein, partial [Armatimonadetes bacterium]|nr:creatininase family protein [Armatimonadota bacterium]